MTGIGIWKTVKIGFWLGIGFIIPQLIVMYSGSVLTVLAMPSLMGTSVEDNVISKFYRSDQIKILEYREKMYGEQLFILGSLVNEGVEDARSIRLEAELTDKNGNFVFECSEYVNKTVKPSEKENFQTKCGCGDRATPDYASVSVRVVGASTY